MAIDPGTIPDQPNPALAAPADTVPSPAPAAVALPVDGGAPGGDSSTTRKFYTITASLREIYDDNVDTSSHGDKQSSLETQLSPSLLVNFPMTDGSFSARYTFDATYYSNRGNNGGSSGGDEGTLEYTHELVAQYEHFFSDRYSLELAERFRYFTEPSLFESTGTNYRNGAYVSNTLNGTLGAQLTPLLSTTTTYSNSIVRYDEKAVALNQNSIENTGSENLSFAILPKISAGGGGIIDKITYDSVARGYTSYTAYLGGQWQALPSLSVSGRGGGSYIQTAGNQDLISPYAALSVNWKIGEKSSLSFSYSHEVTPTDQIGANAQASDRFTGNFDYSITPFLSTHVQGIFTQADLSQNLINSRTISTYQEDDYALDTGLTYHYMSHLDFDFGIIISGVISDMSDREYNRDEAYLGVRGTY